MKTLDSPVAIPFVDVTGWNPRLPQGRDRKAGKSLRRPRYPIFGVYRPLTSHLPGVPGAALHALRGQNIPYPVQMLVGNHG